MNRLMSKCKTMDFISNDSFFVVNIMNSLLLLDNLKHINTFISNILKTLFITHLFKTY